MLHSSGSVCHGHTQRGVTTRCRPPNSWTSKTRITRAWHRIPHCSARRGFTHICKGDDDVHGYGTLPIRASVVMPDVRDYHAPGAGPTFSVGKKGGQQIQERGGAKVSKQATAVSFTYTTTARDTKINLWAVERGGKKKGSTRL
jgi:hypothetical protein